MLYASDLPENMKKFIPNKNLWLIEKKYNKRSFSLVFENHDEALYYQLHYGGRIHTIDCNSKKAYILVYEDKQRLSQSFLPIKEFIYNMQQLQILDVYDKLIRNQIKPIGVKTDGILIRETKAAVENIFKFENKFGELRSESGKKNN